MSQTVTKTSAKDECGRCGGPAQGSQCTRCDGTIDKWANFLDAMYRKNGADAAREYLDDLQDRDGWREGDLNRVAARSDVITRPHPPEEPIEYDDAGQVVFSP